MLFFLIFPVTKNVLNTSDNLWRSQDLQILYVLCKDMTGLCARSKLFFNNAAHIKMFLKCAIEKIRLM